MLSPTTTARWLTSVGVVQTQNEKKQRGRSKDGIINYSKKSCQFVSQFCLLKSQSPNGFFRAPSVTPMNTIMQDSFAVVVCGTNAEWLRWIGIGRRHSLPDWCHGCRSKIPVELTDKTPSSEKDRQHSPRQRFSVRNVKQAICKRFRLEGWMARKNRTEIFPGDETFSTKIARLNFPSLSSADCDCFNN